MGYRASVIGSGGREHAIAFELGRSESIDYVVGVPGNLGFDGMDKGFNLVDPNTDQPIGFNDFDILVKAHKHYEIDYAVVGPEAPLIRGLADAMRHEGIAVVGCGASAARLEGSKAYGYEFAQKCGIACPPSQIFTNYDSAMTAVVGRDPLSYVIKADGEAGGKGAVLTKTTEETQNVLQKMFSGEGFGGAGKDKVLIAERYHGPEVSVFMVRSKDGFVVLPVYSQDHKRLLDGDEGPNTGGMGAYAPMQLTKRQNEKINQIAAQTHEGMSNEGMDDECIIYLGLMLADELDGDPALIEYNVRFGDPEAEVDLPLLNLQDPELVHDIFYATAHNDLKSLLLPRTIGGAVITVCLAAEGYPDNPIKGNEIYGLNRDYEGVIIHHGGTARKDNKIVTNGGRVLYVTALGETIDLAAARAYAAISLSGSEHGIWFDGMQYRKDIAHQARTI